VDRRPGTGQRPGTREGGRIPRLQTTVALWTLSLKSVCLVRSPATSLVNLELGYRLPRGGGGADDVRFHPALPRTARLSLIVGF
jgi:hypothetical protein